MPKRTDGSKTDGGRVQPSAEDSIMMTVALKELLIAARGMAEGDFHRLVTFKAQGEVAQLAHYINQTLHNLQEMDPTLRTSSNAMPTVTSELRDVIKATEVVTHRVLDTAEQLLEEQEQLSKALQEVQAEFAAHPGLSSTMSDLVQNIQERAMAIMAAMEFQDLASQRITQVVTMVSEIEERLVRLLVLFKLQEVSGEPAPNGSSPASLLERLTDQLSTSTGRQEWVDHVLSDFHRQYP